MTDNPPRQAWAGYLRVSTAGQANRETHEAQREAIAEWAEREHHDIEWYTDAGVSGTKNIDSPTFQKMLADLDEKHLTGIVITCIDRLSRDTTGLLNLMQHLGDRGKELISLKEGRLHITAATAEQELTNGIWAVIAGYDRRKTVEKMRAGLERYVRRGGKLGRPRKAIDWKQVDSLLKHGSSIALAARVVGVAPNTLRDRLRKREEAKRHTTNS